MQRTTYPSMSINDASANSSQQRRIARFAPAEALITIMPTTTIDDLSDEEYKSTYCTEEDMVNTQRNLAEYITTIRGLSISDIELEEEYNHTIRGIEVMRSSQTIRNAMQRKMAVIDAVLDEQDEQFDRGIFDSDRLAEISLQAGAAEGTIQRAIDAATVDEEYVDTLVRPTVQVRSNLLRRMSSITMSSEPVPVRRGSGSSVDSDLQSVPSLPAATPKSTIASISQAWNTAEQSPI